MRKSPRHRSAGAIAVLLALTMSGVGTADDSGRVRITDRGAESVVRITDRPVVRGQSSEALAGGDVQQTALFSLCPASLECTDVCCDPGHVHICDGCRASGCPSYHSCPSCSPCGAGHQCPVIGWMSHLLGGAHNMKCNLLESLGIPCHCRQQECRERCRRTRMRSFVCRDREKCRERAICRRERFGVWLSHTRLNYFIPRGCCGKGCPPCGHYQIVYPVDPWYGDARDGGVYAAEGIGGPVSVPLAPVIRHTYNYGWGVPSSRLTPVSHLAMQPVYGGPYGYGPPPAWGPYYANAGPYTASPAGPPTEAASRY